MFRYLLIAKMFILLLIASPYYVIAQDVQPRRADPPLSLDRVLTGLEHALAGLPRSRYLISSEMRNLVTDEILMRELYCLKHDDHRWKMEWATEVFSSQAESGRFLYYNELAPNTVRPVHLHIDQLQCKDCQLLTILDNASKYGGDLTIASYDDAASGQADITNDLLGSLSPAGLLYGYTKSGDRELTLMDVLGISKPALSVDNHSVDGHETYVIKARGRHGLYQVWVDPATGFLPRRVLVTKGPQDLIAGLKLSEQREFVSPATTKKTDPVAEYKVEIHDVTIDRVKGVFCILKYRITQTVTYLSGGITVKEDAVTVREVDPRPVFEDSDFSLNVNVPNGTYIGMRDAPDFDYVWRDGEIVLAATESDINGLHGLRHQSVFRAKLILIVVNIAALLGVLGFWLFQRRKSLR